MSGKGPGWDAKEIGRISREYFGNFETMFAHHGWSERGSDMMRKVQSRVKANYGSVEAFALRFPPK